MVTKNCILEKYKNGIPVIGTITHLKSPTAVECIGVAGLDYVMIDMEHCPIDISEVHNCIIAADVNNILPLVRINDRSRASVLRVLDAGAKGVVIPCIETVEQVKEIIKYGKFQPLGERGYCMTRDGDWGYGQNYTDGLKGYMEFSNHDTLLIPQCETLGCLEHIDEITALDGVDGIMIGPYDLSIGMGIDGQFDHPEFQAAIKKILESCKKNGKMSIIFVGNENDMKQRLSEGFDNILIGLDVLNLINSYKTIADRFHSMTILKKGECV